ncbi:MAG: STAS domain-containing protein [Xanthobacteraceae bacterium]
MAGTDLALPQVLDLTQAQALRDRVADHLRAGALNLDAGAVERASTPCLQVLLAAGRAAERAGTAYRILNASDAFGSALADLGLRAEFSKWMD